MGADPGLHEGGYVLGYPSDEAVSLVENTVKLLRYLARSSCMAQSDGDGDGGDSVGCLFVCGFVAAVAAAFVVARLAT